MSLHTPDVCTLGASPIRCRLSLPGRLGLEVLLGAGQELDQRVKDVDMNP